MSTPDVTKAQLLALAQAIIATLVAFGVNLNNAQQAALLTLSAVLASLLVAADVALRRGRMKHLTPKSDPAPPARIERGVPVSKQLAAVAASSAAAVAAELENGPPPAPGSYPLDEPPGPQPTF